MPYFSSKTKKETIKHKEFVKMYAQKASISEEQANVQINCFIETIYDGMKDHRPITVENFGNFYVAEYKDSLAFKFNPAQKFKAILGWASTFRGEI
jgi:DNA-binding protein HU-beta